MSYYDILGVSKDSSQEQIKKSYRKLSLKYHPDKNGGDDTQFKKINEAFQILGDENNRKNYDMQQSGQNFPNGMNPNMFRNMNGIPPEIFQKMFGGFGHPMFNFNHQMNQGNGPNIKIFRNGVEQTNMNKPVPIIKNVEITLEQAYNGIKFPFGIERWIIEGDIKRVEKETIYIDIPKGIDNNEIIIIRNKGNIISDDNKGDIKLFIKVNNDSEYVRNGINLILNKNITLKEALCGFEFYIKCLNEKKFKIMNTDNVIKPGYSKIIPGLGMVRDGQTGNLIINFQIIFPEKIDENKITMLNEIL